VKTLQKFGAEKFVELQKLKGELLGIKAVKTTVN
jgi:hypothetical protein